MIDGVKNEFFGKYLKFQGRTSRRDFWLTVLGIVIIVFIASFIIGLVGSSAEEGSVISTICVVLLWILEIGISLGALSLDVRRLHDINKSGWWVLISLVPVVGSIILLVFFCLPAVNEGNNY